MPEDEDTESAVRQERIDISYPGWLTSLLEREAIPAEATAVVASHACGGLTDELIRECTTLSVEFAIMPCCHINERGGRQDRLRHATTLLDIPYSVVLDIARLGVIDACPGYKASLRMIDKAISRMNRIPLDILTEMNEDWWQTAIYERRCGSDNLLGISIKQIEPERTCEEYPPDTPHPRAEPALTRSRKAGEPDVHEHIAPDAKGAKDLGGQAELGYKDIIHLTDKTHRGTEDAPNSNADRDRQELHERCSSTCIMAPVQVPPAMECRRKVWRKRGRAKMGAFVSSHCTYGIRPVSACMFKVLEIETGWPIKALVTEMMPVAPIYRCCWSHSCKWLRWFWDAPEATASQRGALSGSTFVGVPAAHTPTAIPAPPLSQSSFVRSQVSSSRHGSSSSSTSGASRAHIAAATALAATAALWAHTPNARSSRHRGDAPAARVRVRAVSSSAHGVAASTEEPDRLVRYMGGNVSVRAVCATDLVRQVCSMHECTPISSVALGRALMAAVLLANGRDEGEKLQLRIMGDGPCGAIISEASSALDCRAFVGEPSADARTVPELVGVGEESTLRVTRTHPYWKSPYTGTTQLKSGEIAEDVVQYLALSEQTPASMGLSVEWDAEAGHVKHAEGWLVTLLPGWDETEVSVVEANIKNFDKMESGTQSRPDAICEHMMRELAGTYQAEQTPKFKCSCSKKRLLTAIMMLGKTEVLKILKDKEDVSAKCDWCGKSLMLAPDEIREYMKTDEGEEEVHLREARVNSPRQMKLIEDELKELSQAEAAAATEMPEKGTANWS
ncbi:unnamed protein product [Polarella glacialis]|uniref:Uncharacterized protein n=1 Tax=Polarella glacialis TaxID=89957 RepID=A0A813GND1_POLGL|nr:unnamed protein product [Polarella glacialis]